MNLSHLRYFVKLADLQHYAKAAKELYISQPSLTHAMKSLESELGVSLFRKVGRGVELTECGRQFKEHVLRGLYEIDRGIEIARRRSVQLIGEVKLGTIYSIEGDYLPSVLTDFNEHHESDVVFKIYQALTLDLISRLENDELDVAFTAYVRNRPELCFEHVISHELVMVCSQDHELASRSSIDLADLRGFEVHTYRAGAPIAEEVDDVTAGIGLNLIGSYEDEVSLGGMISRNSKICGLGTLALGLKLFPNLKVIPINDAPKDFHRIYMVYKRDRFRSEAVEEFIKYVVDYVPGEETRQTVTSLFD
ncbi:LysR family transcriptional regulator [Eggerthellaceae bacterium zg-1084]|uniref:LysR family transcriptional regulator n=1 Tax=Berryella wangjianweii TaxID=2734634 RepID=UPI0015539007|nr:LysR family transcriptional regulator [Berryella wangjianweii]NPD31535.1 LysR family transcriptional regulator [Berryella wangjianweii]NPD32970.1 LysR family transcriptional regulator [Eggerthellaceae bacterium zg-997]